jgi:chromosome segregation ATPase
MDPAVIGVLAAVATGGVLKLLDWLLARSGRQISGQKNTREQLEMLWKRVESLEKEVESWRDRYAKLQSDYDDLWRKYQVLVVEMTAIRLAKKE